MAVVRWRLVNNHTDGRALRPRHGHQAVSCGTDIYVYGGGNEGILDDLLVFDTAESAWRKPVTSGSYPKGCAAYGMTTDGDSRLFIYGGMAEYGKYSEALYQLDVAGGVWSQLVTTGPSPGQRLGLSANYVDNKLYIFGGVHISKNKVAYSNDMYVLDLETMHWSIPVVDGVRPCARESHRSCVYNGQLVMYGGMNGKRLGDVWVFDTGTHTWTQAATGTLAHTPCARSLHTMVVVGSHAYVFAGWSPVVGGGVAGAAEEWECTNSLGCLDLDTLSWIDVDVSGLNSDGLPKARAGHCAAVVGTRMFMWSGRDGYRENHNNSQVCCQDLWLLETAPPPKSSAFSPQRITALTVIGRWSPVPTADAYRLQIMLCHDQTEPPSKLPSPFNPVLQSHEDADSDKGDGIQRSQSSDTGTIKQGQGAVTDATKKESATMPLNLGVQRGRWYEVGYVKTNSVSFTDFHSLMPASDTNPFTHSTAVLKAQADSAETSTLTHAHVDSHTSTGTPMAPGSTGEAYAHSPPLTPQSEQDESVSIDIHTDTHANAHEHEHADGDTDKALHSHANDSEDSAKEARPNVLRLKLTQAGSVVASITGTNAPSTPRHTVTATATATATATHPDTHPVTETGTSLDAESAPTGVGTTGYVTTQHSHKLTPLGDTTGTLRYAKEVNVGWASTGNYGRGWSVAPVDLRAGARGVRAGAKASVRNSLSLDQFTLTPHTLYYVRLAGVNGCGQGDWSDEVQISTKDSSVPSIPGPLHFQIAGSTMYIEWSAPEECGGTEITCYNIDVAVDGLSNIHSRMNGPTNTYYESSSTYETLYTGRSTSCTVDIERLLRIKLPNGGKIARYWFRVNATNKTGPSVYSEASLHTLTNGTRMSDHDVSVAMATTHDPAHPSQTHYKTHRNSTVNSHATSTTHRRKGNSTHAHPADTTQHPHPHPHTHTHTHASAKAAPGSEANGSSATRPPTAKASTTSCRPRTAKAAAARGGSRGSNDDAAMTSTSTQKSKNTTTAPSTGASESAEALGRLLQNALAAHTRTTTDHNSHEPNSHNHVDRGIHTVDSRIGQGGQPQHTVPSGTSPMDGVSGQVSTTGTDTNVSRQLGQADGRARRGSGNHGNAGWVYGAKAEWKQGEGLDDGYDDGRAGDQQLRRRSQPSTDSTTQETPQAHSSAHDAHMDNAIALGKDKSTGVTASVDGQGREGAYVYAGSISAAHDTHMTPQQAAYHPHEQTPHTQQQPCTQGQPYGNNTTQHGTVGDSNTHNTTTTGDHRPYANAQQQHTHTHAPSLTHAHAHAHMGPHETHSTGAAYAHIHSGNSGGSRSRKNSERDSDTGDGKKIKRIRRPPSEIERAYVCDVTECDKGYGSQGALDLHRKTKHDIAKKGKDLHNHSSADLWSG